MSSPKLRSRKVKSDGTQSDSVVVETTSNRDVTTKEAAIGSLNVEDTALSTECTKSMEAVPWMRRKLIHQD